MSNNPGAICALGMRGVLAAARSALVAARERALDAPLDSLTADEAALLALRDTKLRVIAPFSGDLAKFWEGAEYQKTPLKAGRFMLDVVTPRGGAPFASLAARPLDVFAEAEAVGLISAEERARNVEDFAEALAALAPAGAVVARE